LKSFEVIMRDKARQRMADLRNARKSHRAALAFERRFGLADGSKRRVTNLQEVFEAMAQSEKD
jgi:hypothetical protein